MTGNAYIDTPCERCGSKRKVSRRWKETIPTFTGTTEVEYSQIVCTDKACQDAFEEALEKETKKREALRMEKEEKTKIRKANMILHTQSSSKNSSRI